MNGDVRLVLSDVDGTLLTSTKRLTPAAVAAVGALGDRGVHFALTSGRPPRGMTMLFEPLHLQTPIAAFNGGLIVDRDLRTLRELSMDDDAVAATIEVLGRWGVSTWVFQGTDWFVLDADGPHVRHEADVCQFEPIVVASFDAIRGDVVKVVGVSDDTPLVDAAREELHADFADALSATNSQPYYLDVTHRDANKGSVVEYLAQRYDIEPDHVAVIGDMSNDLLMFAKAGVRIAMGNASADVRDAADHVTKSNDEDGFAFALTTFLS